MKAAYVKCLYCQERFNKNDINIQVKQVSARRYAHLSCWNNYIANLSQEEKDEQAFYEYVKQLFKNEYNYILTKKLAERFIKENHYTYSGMLKTLKWYYEKEGNDIEKSNGSIGIIPYIYSKAEKYYYSLFLAKQINAEKNLIHFSNPKIKEIIIKSPRVQTQAPKLWLEEDD